MNTKGIVIVVIAAIIVVGAVVWNVGSKKETTNSNSNVPANNNSSSANTNTAQVNVTYAPYSGTPEARGFTFDTVMEWTSVAPSEIEKAITAEQRHGYSIGYYATNTEAVIFAVSVKSVDEQPASMEAVVNDDTVSAQAEQPSYAVTDKQVTVTDARIIATFTAAATDYTTYSRYLGLPADAYGKPSWALLEISIPTPRRASYSAVVEHLLGSLVLKDTSQTNTNVASDATNGFAANGEKINDRVYTENFRSIEIGILKKNADPSTMVFGAASIDYDAEQNGYRVVTTDAFAGTRQMTIKAYDYTAGRLFDGSASMEVKQGSNTQCCSTPPGKGRYQYLFYLGSDLVKALELVSG